MLKNIKQNCKHTVQFILDVEHKQNALLTIQLSVYYTCHCRVFGIVDCYQTSVGIPMSEGCAETNTFL